MTDTIERETTYLLERGHPYPFGAMPTENGVNFALASKRATWVTLCLWNAHGEKLVATFALDARQHRTGDVWHAHVRGIKAPLVYGYRVGGPSEKYYRFDPETVQLDPYAKALLPPSAWGERKAPFRGVVLPHVAFDWEGDLPLQRPREELVIYEAYLRGFTQHPSSSVTQPGTYLGFIEKIPHLVELGITAVEFLPIFAFDENTNPFKDPETEKPLLNVWGYSPLSFFTPMPSYANANPTESAASAPLLEFKALVKALHSAGISVILDVVYNHTGEELNGKLPASLQRLDYPAYYYTDANGHPLDFSGCGNSLNGNAILMKELILASLRYWVTEMHVDGFRFDLASVMNRGKHGRPLGTSPLVEAISQDPILAHTLLIAEPWDAAGMYQVGAFYPQEDRWSEWNGKYRDSARQFLNGIGSWRGEFATRLSGSQDLYGHCRRPASSINFITAHDGFTLNDLFTYTHKHNDANGEKNRDGTSDNYSWNCGHEGPTDESAIVQLRQQQRRNAIVALCVSQGIPMLFMGDEYGHTKLGNNNSYCQDNALNWFLWDQLTREQPFYRFCRGLLAIRKRHPHLFAKATFLTPDDIAWHEANGTPIEWEAPERFLAFTLFDRTEHIERCHLYIAFNVTSETVDVTLPTPPPATAWHRLVDTALAPPLDYIEEANAPRHDTAIYKMPPRSSLILKSLKS